MQVPKKLWWAAALAALVIGVQIGTTPKRSDDLRVALMNECPVAKGALESGGAAQIVSVFADAAASAVLKTAVQVARAYGQPHASPPRVGATAEHFYLLGPRGEVMVNRQVWNCLVVVVEDLRAAPTPASNASAADDDGVRDPYTRERVFLEARIVHSAEGSAFELQPVTLRFRASAEPSLLGSAARDLQFDVAFSTPGASAPFARTVVDFRALVPSAKAQWRSDQLGTELAKRSGWLPAPPLGTALAARAQELKAAKPGGEARRTSVHGPTTVTVSLVETREGSVLWKWFGDLLESFSSAPQNKG